MNSNDALDKILNAVPPPPTNLVDNWQTAFVWLALAIVVFALIALLVNLKRGFQGKHVNKGMLPFIKWPLLFASAGFNIFFTYYVFLPAGQTVAIFSAVVMGGVNLAEAYLVRLIIATWRHDMKTVFRMALVFTIPVFAYSLMAAGSSFSTMMKKNGDSLAASQLELQAAQDVIKHADSQVQEAQIGANNGKLLNALYQADVRNSQGVKVGFHKVKESCSSGGYYARAYPELCNQYQNLRNGTHTAASVASAQTAALATSASQKMEMAKIIKERPPEITPTLLGFALGIAAVGFIVSLALESAIIGVGFFEELFVKPTPLPGLVKFANKALDWDAKSITQRGLQVDVSPSPGTVGFSGSPVGSSPFSSFGWDAKNPSQPSAKVGGEPSAKVSQTFSEGSAKPSPEPSAEGAATFSEGRGETFSEGSEKPKWLNRWNNHFSEYSQEVKAGRITPTIKPTVQYLSQHDVVGYGIKNIEATAYLWLERLVEQGIAKPNPHPGKGKAKYVLA